MLAEIGRLTQEVEVKTVSVSGAAKSVLNNRLAISVDKEITVFIDLSAWGGMAEFIGKYFAKGGELYVEGELRNKTNKIGDKEISVPYLLVSKVKFTHGNKTE